MTTVAVLGTGIMGSGMAGSLLRAGFDVRAWNRSPEKAQPLAEKGATVHTDPGTAVSGADMVLTMVFDADAVESVMADALPAMAADAVWAQSATIGVEATERCAALATKQGVAYVDSPVLGTRKPAEEGTLVVLAGGPRRLEPSVAPVFDAIGSRTIWVGEQPGDGHRLKLCANSWVLSITGATAQAVALAKASGIDPALFLEAIAGSANDCAYAQLKGKAMIAGDFSPAFTLAGGAKDARLIAAAMRVAAVDDTIMSAVEGRLSAAQAGGHGDEDLAAVITAMT